MTAPETSDSDSPLLRTPLHGLHYTLGARMVPFAGYEMPLQYPPGILQEHRHTRAEASVFDVSHMGQAWVTAKPGSGLDAATLLERLSPGDLRGLAPGQQRYTQLLAPDGGILDDLIVTRPADPARADSLYIVVNAARRAADFAAIEAALDGDGALEPMEERALVAVQGPDAAAAVERLFGPGPAKQPFMTQRAGVWSGAACLISRSGYTGEDGFELSIPARSASALTEAVLALPNVTMAGLGARDSLRLEAGLCLYGQDIDETTTPVEAGLTWSLGKRRRADGDFPGAARVLAQISEGPARRRVGLRPSGRIPARPGAAIVDADGASIGTVTSGGFGPTVEAPVAMGYVARAHAKAGTEVHLRIRDATVPAEVVKMPFVPANYYRG